MRVGWAGYGCSFAKPRSKTLCAACDDGTVRVVSLEGGVGSMMRPGCERERPSGSEGAGSMVAGSVGVDPMAAYLIAAVRLRAIKEPERVWPSHVSPMGS